MIPWLPQAHLALSFVILLWDVALAGRIAQLRQATRPFAAVNGFCALLVVPALILHLATSTVITGRAVYTMDWVWPVVLVMFAAQALYALGARLVNPTWGVPILFYDLMVAGTGIIRYAIAHGVAVPHPLVALLVAYSDGMAVIDGPAALTSPFFLLMPMVSPAFPALRPLTASFRATLSAIAVGWLVLVALEMPQAAGTLRSYDVHANERLTERFGNFDIGLKIFPDVGGAVPPPAIASDIPLADTLGVDVISVDVIPDVNNRVLDSLSHSLDQLQRDSVLLIVTMGYRGKLLPELRHASLKADQRIAAIPQIVRRLDPDILLPAEDPYGEGARILGRLPVDRWKQYLTRAAAAAKRVNPRIRVGVSISAFDSRDSALYAWAASSGSPMDVVGFTLLPSREGAAGLDASMRAADRWMQVMPPAKDHWVFAAGGLPLAHGERSQEEALWDALSWSTLHPAIKGLIVYEAGDYGQSLGIRAPNGRLRPAAYAVLRAMKVLGETGTP